jgi:hypothetical protein
MWATVKPKVRNKEPQEPRVWSRVGRRFRIEAKRSETEANFFRFDAEKIVFLLVSHRCET